MTASRIRVGLISDTHGLLRPEAVAALAGVDCILHAGDVGAPEVLQHLRAVAPVFAVRGNNDHGPWANELPERLEHEVGGLVLLMLHDRKDLGAVPSDVDVIVSGHSHKPSVEEQGSVLFVNPGSAGPRRFSLPISVAILTIRLGEPQVDLVELAIGPKATSAAAPKTRPRRTAAPGPFDDLPDARDGLSRKERLVLFTLTRLQKERNGRDVPLPQLYGHVLEHVDISMGELQRIVQRLGARR